MKKSTALGTSRFRGARNPHVFQYTLRLLVPSLGLAPSGLARRFAPGETVLRPGRMRLSFARDDFSQPITRSLGWRDACPRPHLSHPQKRKLTGEVFSSGGVSSWGWWSGLCG
ncbi:MAG: hypothetical protein ACREYE_21840 [Gammaproteobacteria bacterium]